MNITTELIQGFGRTIKAIRQREGITQKAMATGMGIGTTILKRYELEKLEDIGPNGFSISIFAKLSEFAGIPPKRLFDEIVTRCPSISKHEDVADIFTNLLHSFSSDDLKTLTSVSSDESQPFGNKLNWILKMAANLARLDEKQQAKIGVQILQELIEEKSATETEIASELQQLFGRTLQR